MLQEITMDGNEKNRRKIGGQKMSFLVFEVRERALLFQDYVLPIVKPRNGLGALRGSRVTVLGGGGAHTHLLLPLSQERGDELVGLC